MFNLKMASSVRRAEIEAFTLLTTFPDVIQFTQSGEDYLFARQNLTNPDFAQMDFSDLDSSFSITELWTNDFIWVN